MRVTLATIRARLQALEDARSTGDDVHSLTSDEIWQRISDGFDRGDYANARPADRELLEKVLVQASEGRDAARRTRAQEMLQALRGGQPG